MKWFTLRCALSAILHFYKQLLCGSVAKCVQQFWQMYKTQHISKTINWIDESKIVQATQEITFYNMFTAF